MSASFICMNDGSFHMQLGSFIRYLSVLDERNDRGPTNDAVAPATTSSTTITITSARATEQSFTPQSEDPNSPAPGFSRKHTNSGEM
jgi:hypothetical protein